MRIGIYGGTFNPPHAGHVHAAEEAGRVLNLDKLLIIPDNLPPHKELPEGSPKEKATVWTRFVRFMSSIRMQSCGC